MVMVMADVVGRLGRYSLAAKPGCEQVCGVAGCDRGEKYFAPTLVGGVGADGCVVFVLLWECFVGLVCFVLWCGVFWGLWELKGLNVQEKLL